MDETALDPDTDRRALCLEAALWYFDRTGDEVKHPGDVVNVAEVFMHYLTNGEATEFHCKDELRKCVRGE